MAESVSLDVRQCKNPEDEHLGASERHLKENTESRTSGGPDLWGPDQEILEAGVKGHKSDH